MFMGLTTEAADASVIPGAAESWEVSDDGTVYTFTLRDHTWSDGTPVTADDFVFALRRILDPAEAAEYASLLYTIKNAKALNEGALEGMEQLSVRALDPKTLEITLESPTPYFIEQLTHYTAFPVPKHKVEEFGDDWVKPGNIVGNGCVHRGRVAAQHPRQVGEERRVLRRRQRRRSTPSTIYPSEERNAATKRFRAGEIDIQYDFASEQIDWLKENLPDETRIAPYLGIYYYVINIRNAPFDNLALRQALAMAIDREAITDKVLRTGELPAYSFVPPGTGNYGEPAYVEWRDMPYQERLAQRQGADGRGRLRRRTTRSGSSSATTPRRPTRRWRSRSPRCGSSSASRPSCSIARSRSTTTISRRVTSRSRGPPGSPTTTSPELPLSDGQLDRRAELRGLRQRRSTTG